MLTARFFRTQERVNDGHPSTLVHSETEGHLGVDRDVRFGSFVGFGQRKGSREFSKKL